MTRATHTAIGTGEDAWKLNARKFLLEELLKVYKKHPLHDEAQLDATRCVLTACANKTHPLPSSSNDDESHNAYSPSEQQGVTVVKLDMGRRVFPTTSAEPTEQMCEITRHTNKQGKPSEAESEQSPMNKNMTEFSDMPEPSEIEFLPAAISLHGDSAHQGVNFRIIESILTGSG